VPLGLREPLSTSKEQYQLRLIFQLWETFPEMDTLRQILDTFGFGQVFFGMMLA
jgi:hypothetical protein